ncbi:MAG: BamA/TamA family outer membrane protein [Candidatus Neomarinimicrobiota bacterium]
MSCSTTISRDWVVFSRLLPLLLAATGLFAQGEGLLITSVVVEGNEVTREHIIIRELSHPLNQPFDSTLARKDRDRLYNLGIFEWVDLYPRPTAPGEAALVVEVVETIRMVPVPIFYYLDELGWSYGGALSYLNFRGLNQRLDISATYGAEKSHALVFSDPWLVGNQIGVSGWLLQIYRGHPVHNFRTRIQDLELGLGKMSRLKTVSIWGAVSLERRRIHWLDKSGREDTVHRFFQSKFDFLLRTTDIWRDPTQGYRFNLYVSPAIGLDKESPTYTYVRVAGAWFYPLRPGPRPLVFGMGLTVAHYLQETPFYAKQYVGGYWVRGYRVDPRKNPPEVQGRQETNSLAAASMELRQTLIPRRLLWQMELGLSGVLFVDAGWGYGPAEPLWQAQPLVGYGLGLRVFVPILYVVALDLGTNPYDTRLRFRLRIGHAI